jgi:hypothetical protein
VTAAKRRKCEGGCGRWLTAAVSLAVGYGPDCLRKRAGSSQDGRAAPQGPGVPAGLSRRLTATHTAPLHPGQTELPLTPMQPTLWSI